MSQETRNSTADNPEHISVPLAQVLSGMGAPGERLAQEVKTMATRDGERQPGQATSQIEEDK